MNKENRNKVQQIMLVICALSEVTASAYFYGKSLKDMLLVFVLTGLVMFYFLAKENVDGIKAVTILIGLTVSILMPLLPVTCRFFAAVMLLNLLVLGKEAAAMLTFYLLGLTSYLAKENIISGLIYFVLCMLVVFVFDNLKYSYQFKKPLYLAALFQVVAELLLIVYITDDYTFSDVIIMGILNIFINFILMLIILKLYSSLILHKERDRFRIINDQEFELLRKMKEEYAELYYEGIHLNRYCMRIGGVLGINTDLLRADCYFHGIREMTKDKTDEEVIEIGTKYMLPKMLMDFLLRYKKNFVILSKEDAAFLIIHTVVMRLYKEATKGTGSDQYFEIVKEELDNMFFGKKLTGSGLTLDEYLSILEVFKEEKMYYEFMCRK